MTAVRTLRRQLAGSHVGRIILLEHAAMWFPAVDGQKLVLHRASHGLGRQAGGLAKDGNETCCLQCDLQAKIQHIQRPQIFSTSSQIYSKQQAGSLSNIIDLREHLHVRRLRHSSGGVLQGRPLAASAVTTRESSAECIRSDGAKPHLPQPVATDFEYTAPLSHTLLRLKRLSLFSCFASLASGPVLVAFDSTTALGSKLGIGACVASFGVFTTALLHWFTSPYVHKLRYHRATQQISTERLSFLARPIYDTFSLSSIEPANSMRPQTTFAVKGSLFYVDKDHFGDEELYKRLDMDNPQNKADNVIQ